MSNDDEVSWQMHEQSLYERFCLWLTSFDLFVLISLFRLDNLWLDWRDIWICINCAVSWQNQQNDLCAERRLRSAWAYAQSDQSLRCPHEDTLGKQLPIERTAMTLIRQGGCPGWSESSLGALFILLVLSCGGSYASVSLKIWFRAN